MTEYVPPIDAELLQRLFLSVALWDKLLDTSHCVLSLFMVLQFGKISVISTITGKGG